DIGLVVVPLLDVGGVVRPPHEELDLQRNALRDKDVVTAVRISLPATQSAEGAARHRRIDGLDADRSDPSAAGFVGYGPAQVHRTGESGVDVERLGRELLRV